MSLTPNTQATSVSKKRWAAYVAAGAAATLTGTQSAEADITHVVVSDGEVALNSGRKSFALDGDAGIFFGNSSTSSGDGLAFAGVLVDASSNQFGNLAGFLASSFPYASNLAFDANVSAAPFLTNSFGTLAYGGGYANSQFLNSTGSPSTGFVGFRFDTTAGGTDWRFGWARITLNGDTPLNTFVVEEYAFGDFGDSIRVGEIGAVPEPGSLGCLALGAVGLLASRRRKKAN